MSIWEAFGMGRYKGFSREAGLLLDEAVELAGGFGCKKADTGHLLLAMLQTDRGAAGRFLAGKNITELAVRRQLSLRYGVECQIKWPNDLLLNGKKVVGILCESVSYGYQQQGRGILCGIGINLAQPQSYFDAANLPNGTSLALQGANVDLAADPAWLAEGLTDFGFDRNLYTFARDGFAPFREEYKAACVNLGRRVTFDLPEGGQGAGEAIDVDEEGRLVVRTDSGEVHVFTGEVSVHGIYGAV